MKNEAPPSDVERGRRYCMYYVRTIDVEQFESIDDDDRTTIRRHVEGMV